MSVRLPLAAIAVALLIGAGCRTGDDRPNVLLITLDTTRRDRLGFYGNDRSTTPSLDVLAKESLVFDRALAASSWTLPSHASMFTGKFPASHGAQYDPNGPLRLTEAIDGPEEWSAYRASGLSPDERTLAESLAEAGYRTAAVVGGPWMKKVFGLDRGFEVYDDREIGDVNGRLASEVTSAALELLKTDDPRPFFLFLNYFDPHGPYEAPSPFGGSLGAGTVDRYDEEILYMDHHIGRLFEEMKRTGLFDDTLVLVTADHGELLGEHGKMGHGTTLFEEEVRIPFLVKDPGEGTRGRTDEPVHHVDVLPMILERVGIGSAAKREHALMAELVTLEGDLKRAFYFGRYKLHWSGDGRHALYEIAADPGEERDLSASQPERVSQAAEVLAKYVSSLPPPGASGPEKTLDEETRRALRSLGYVP